MKIVFIELPHIYLMQQKTQAPLGLMYLASSLRQKGYIDIEIKRLISLDEFDLENKIPDADIYGISSVSLDYASAKTVARRLRKRKNGKVIIGGYHATAETEFVLEETDEDGSYLWDSVCKREFDEKIIEVVKDVELNNLKRLYVGDQCKNLDDIPFPARDLIYDQGGSIFAYDKHYSENKLSTVICSSRGCPFKCTFCATSVMWCNVVRFRSPDNLAKEIDECIDKYNIKEFRFSDELFTINKKRVLSLMEKMKDREIYWKCSTRSDCVDEEIIIAMKNSGCKEIAFGVESADPDVLVAINKKNSIEKSIKALSVCNEIGVNTRVLMMINTPGETVYTVDKNIEFLEKIPFTCASLSVFKPLPGSAVWDNPEKYGIEILDRDLDKYNIYMWINGQLEENNSEDVFRILSLPSIEVQINNKKRMLDYFYKTKKMNELDNYLKMKNKKTMV